jgi:hypothetical protein
MSKGKPINILLVEDEPAHAEAIRRAFRTVNPATLVRVIGTLREYREVVAVHTPTSSFWT